VEFLWLQLVESASTINCPSFADEAGGLDVIEGGERREFVDPTRGTYQAFF
jgi:hypothetical protein